MRVSDFFDRSSLSPVRKIFEVTELACRPRRRNAVAYPPDRTGLFGFQVRESARTDAILHSTSVVNRALHGGHGH